MYFGIFYFSKSVFLLVKVNSTCLSSCLSLSLSLYLLMCLVWLLSRTKLQVLCYVLVKALVCTSLLVSNIFSLQNLLDLKELRDPGGGSGLMKWQAGEEREYEVLMRTATWTAWRLPEHKRQAAKELNWLSCPLSNTMDLFVWNHRRRWQSMFQAGYEFSWVCLQTDVESAFAICLGSG